MKIFKIVLTLFVFTSLTAWAQPRSGAQGGGGKKVKITGKVIAKSNNQPLEYTEVRLISTATNKVVTGGLTDAKGEFNIDAPAGNYNVNVEFLSFKPLELKNKSIQEDTNLGTISLEDEATKLDEVVIRKEKTSVEIKLDKKVYNVGQDLMVKGGTVSDVLDNIPSVAVDSDGTISLRGNDNVKILIDGRPSNAINISDALRMIPADAIDKVEVVTNPSARYDAEGGGGILNILLKKGKNNGVNGTIMGTTGIPDNHGLSATLNVKSDEFNFFTNQGYNYRNNPGKAQMDSRYLNADNSTRNYINESRDSDRYSKGYNGNFGFDWFLTKKTTWTNTVNYRKNNGTTEENVDQINLDQFANYTKTVFRDNNEDTKSENVEFASNLLHKFNTDGHKLTVDFSVSKNKDDNDATITNADTQNSPVVINDTYNIQRQNRILLQSDYVLPFGKNKESQFEAGYRGNFLDLLTDYSVFTNGVLDTYFSNVLNYKENVNALYSQLGTKIKKFSFLAGLRYENSNIIVDQQTSQIYKTKNYDNFFPSATVAYEINETSNIAINYSKRINRPRGREINPFSSYSSNINIFQGNPDLNPSKTDAIDFGFLKKWTKLTFNTSMYFNRTVDNVQYVRRESGEFVGTTPVIITTPVNLSKEYRTGFEFTFNYTPYKWWKINTNFNFFRVETIGKYTYVLPSTSTEKTTDFANVATTWSSRITSKITLPGKIDWQTNANYNGPQNTAQGRNLGVFGMNLGFSKDVFKDKATLALNVNDVFNSRKRRFETFIPGQVDANSMMQWRVRQVTLSFTYRFNKTKNDKEQNRPKRNGGDDNDGGDYPG
ncbi:outer membrane beta-barrel family protein [Flavobacterium stagni]|uniref:TonB-dependent receptor n=1 Tax=Flavobacterium stagni TaxID=2506421 RepID=A0A4Q1KA72_9FLAO|nr:outer membrane beta-barrel family protein [Flavobacterium stagni]RXR23022.1 TonB-dependent receptor [Flavobacterium stagni]